jgi:hypothetical protein
MNPNNMIVLLGELTIGKLTSRDLYEQGAEIACGTKTKSVCDIDGTDDNDDEG